MDEDNAPKGCRADNTITSQRMEPDIESFPLVEIVRNYFYVLCNHYLSVLHYCIFSR